MLDFRKTFLTFAAVGLVLAGTASAQVAPLAAITPTGGTGYVAVEGVTEVLNPVVVSFGTNSGVSGATLVLTSNVPFTMGSSAGKLDVTAVADSATSTSTTTITQTGPTTLQVVFSGLSGAMLNTITLTGLRVNGSLAPSSSQITLAATGVAGGGITGSLPAAPVAFVVISEVLPGITPSPTQSLCMTSSSSLYPVTTVNVQENFATAFKVLSSYSGPSLAASQGTVLAVTFTNLNPGVVYYVPSSVTSATGLTLTAYTGATGATAAPQVTVGGVSGLVALTLSGTSATAYFGVTAASAGIDSASILLSENIPTPSTVTSVSTSPVGASVSLVGVTSGYPQFAANTYAGTITGTGSLLTTCQTTLLFPYATNTQGYDMGFAISNASKMPGSSPVQQSGTCSVSFYGTAAPAAVFVTPSIAAGSLDTEILSNVAPGFDGYIVAVCNFQKAYGYAIISNGFATGTGGVSGNYLAIPQ